MLKLVVLNAALIAVIVVGLVIVKKKVNTDRGTRAVFLISSVATVLVHYSSLLYHWINGGTALQYLASNPNLLLPIYPCNVVMWCCLIFGFQKRKTTRFARFLADYIFWFGIFAALAGMFANVDFIRQPTFADYDVTKSIVAHAFMLFNILLFPVMGYVKVDLPKNYLHVLISMGLMYVCGTYCNMVFAALDSVKTARSVNSMFIIQSPFPQVPFLKYPVVCLFAAVVYFILFQICDLIAYRKNNRWLSRTFGRK